MSLRQRLLRFFQPKTERERQDYRLAVACASAHAEELDRCVRQLVDSPSQERADVATFLTR